MNNIPPEKRQPFLYHDKGSMATIGKAKAVAEIRGWRFSGLFAWLLWSAVHLFFLITFRAKLFVMINWIYTYVFHTTGARLITGDFKPRIRKFRDVTPRHRIKWSHDYQTFDRTWYRASDGFGSVRGLRPCQTVRQSDLCCRTITDERRKADRGGTGPFAVQSGGCACRGTSMRPSMPCRLFGP
ncbi:MAG: hypothetical protein KatS3mg104_1456 [Phycisphaerae bacterium]|nr:MAG: hypothetical protein KatS3mg104_1456 [Phycisphaerae bacterium]